MVLLTGLAVPGAAALASAGLYTYTLAITPEEGPLVPAVQRRYTPQFTRCQSAAKVTRENAACFTAEFIRQDEALNRAWKATLSRTSPPLRQALINAQRRWIAARDPFCQREYAATLPGTIAPVIYASCRTELTIRRTLWLEGLSR